MKALLGLLALLALSYVMADKEAIPEKTRAMNRWARPLCFFSLGFAFLFFFVL